MCFAPPLRPTPLLSPCRVGSPPPRPPPARPAPPRSAAGDRGVFDAIVGKAREDVAHRKLFVRDLEFTTTSEELTEAFRPFGELEEAIVVADHARGPGHNRGYGFVTYKTAAAAREALESPHKVIKGRQTMATLAATGQLARDRRGAGGAGSSGDGGRGGARLIGAGGMPQLPTASTNGNGSGGSGRHGHGSPRHDGGDEDLSLRKLFVRNLSWSTNNESLAAAFSAFGTVHEAAVMYHSDTHKSKGYGFVTFTTVAGANRALERGGTVVVDGREAIANLAAAGATRGTGKRQRRQWGPPDTGFSAAGGPALTHGMMSGGDMAGNGHQTQPGLTAASYAATPQAYVAVPAMPGPPVASPTHGGVVATSPVANGVAPGGGLVFLSAPTSYAPATTAAPGAMGWGWKQPGSW